MINSVLHSQYLSKKRPASSSHILSSKRLPNVRSFTSPNTAHDPGTNRVICTLDSIDSIKSLKRSPQHIFVEVRVPGFQVPESNFRVSGFPISEFRVENPIPRLRTFIHICQKPSFHLNN
ncbi:hypothetical protein Avbf_18117 [Armadillidium vulgare]|nr:hypothetical protein Avbf_18117 [Armadillidium vulgare]